MQPMILLHEVPRRCPMCNGLLFSCAPKPRISRKALITAMLGVPLSGLWTLLFWLSSKKFFVPNGVGGFLLYLWPAFVTVWHAMGMPEVVIAKCYQCSWRRTFPIRKPRV